MVLSKEIVDNKRRFLEIIQNNNGKLVFKFSAEWCGPCKKILPMINDFKETIKDDETITWIDIDVDDSIEVFGMLKTKRIVNGVPAILVYLEDNEEIYPDEFVIGANEKDIEYLFSKIME